MKNLRIRRGDLQVPERTYYNDMTGRYFHLIGVCHLASQKFWHSTESRIEDLKYTYKGAEVHHEGVANDVDFGATPRAGEPDNFVLFGRALGLVYQTEGLPRKSDWIRTDLTMSQILDRLKDPFAFMTKQRDVYKALGDARDLMGTTPWAARWFRRLLRYGVFFHHLFPRNTDERRVIIDERNRHAVSTMVTTGTDIITLWGAEHLKGMGKMLEDCGYDLISTNWSTCVPRKTTI